jgi:hypothetical protein
MAPPGKKLAVRVVRPLLMVASPPKMAAEPEDVRGPWQISARNPPLRVPWAYPAKGLTLIGALHVAVL